MREDLGRHAARREDPGVFQPIGYKSAMDSAVVHGLEPPCAFEL